MLYNSEWLAIRGVQIGYRNYRPMQMQSNPAVLLPFDFSGSFVKIEASSNQDTSAC